MTERLYYDNPALKRFDSCISDIRLVSRTDGKALWQVALESSAFYPTSGGQPFDRGVLRAASRSGAVLEVPVISVEEDEHGEVWHTVEKPLSSGTEVEGEIDWPRRLDHMQQHSGQHLLSAVFATELNALTTSFHLGDRSSTIDLKTGDSKFDPAQAARLERIANELIAENRNVSIRTIEPDAAQALLASGQLRKLPGRRGAIRLIEIDDYDLNACGGTHVHSTGQIGSLLIRSTEKVRDGLRVEFVCGLRAVATARRERELVSRVSAALSVGSEQLPEAVERLLAENKSAAKERQRLREQLAEMHAAQLIARDTPSDGLRVIRYVFDQRTHGSAPGPVDAEYCKLLASRIVASASRVLVLFSVNHAPSATLIVAASKGQAFSCGDLLRAKLAKLGLRGGGSREMAQGQLHVEQAVALLDAVENAARAEASSARQQPTSISAG